MISDLATNGVINTKQPEHPGDFSPEQSQKTPALRPWSTPRLHRLNQSDTDSGILATRTEGFAAFYVPPVGPS